MTFADRLRALRKAASLTQEQLSLACGWQGQSRISNYETGAREPSLDELPVIARALGAPIAALLDDGALLDFQEGRIGGVGSQLSRRDAENIVTAVEGLLRQRASLTVDSLLLAYAFVVDRDSFKAPVVELTKPEAVTIDGTERRGSEGTGESLGRKARRRTP